MKRIEKVTKSIIAVIIMLTISIFMNKTYAAELAVSASGNNVTISSEYTGRVNISVSGGTASESSIWLENSSQTISISNVSSDGATVTVTPASMSDSDGNAKTVAAKSVKIASSNTGSSSRGTTSNTNNNSNTNKTDNNKTTEPTFKSANETVYATGNINIRKSYSADSDKVGTLETGEKVTRTGIGDNGWSKVTYSGGTGYIKSSLLTTEEPKKSEDKALKTLTITGVELDPAFDPEITDYSVTVGKDVEKLEITTAPNDEKATVEITGNEGLKAGDNIIKIVVTAEDKTARTYTINAVKANNDKLGLTVLKIDGYTISPKFSPDTYDYKLTILDPNVTKLNVTTTASNEKAKVEVEGNNSISQGENVITIKVTSEDGKETATYKVVVTKNATSTTSSSNNQNNWILYAGIGVIALLVIIIVVIVIRSRRNNEYDYDEDEEEENDDLSNKMDDTEYNNFKTEDDKKRIEDELFGKLPSEKIEETNKYDTFNFNPYDTQIEPKNEENQPNNYMQTTKEDYNDYTPTDYNVSNENEDYLSSKDDWEDEYKSRRSKGKHSK